MKTEDHYSPMELEIAHVLGQGVPEPFAGETAGGGVGGAG
jgi:NADH-quinone oxidoreductase subunit C